MDSILKSFSIGFLLRSVFSGVFFVVSYYVASHHPVDLSTIDGKTLLSLWLPVALFAGVTTYGLHRSLFYPFIECWHDSDCGKALRQRMPLIRVSTIHILLWRPLQYSDARDKTCTSTHGLTSYIFSTLRLIALFWVLSSAGLLSPLSIFLIGLSSVLRLSFSLLLLFQIGEHIRFWIISGMSLTMRCSPQPLRRCS